MPCPDPAERAVKMAMAMREAAGTLIADWRERGRDLGFGAGIAQGYATLGQIGFSDRSGYTAIGTVCNVAARLCAEAKDDQILLGQRVNEAPPFEKLRKRTEVAGTASMGLLDDARIWRPRKTLWPLKPERLLCRSRRRDVNTL